MSHHRHQHGGICHNCQEPLYSPDEEYTFGDYVGHKFHRRKIRRYERNWRLLCAAATTFGLLVLTAILMYLVVIPVMADFGL